MIIKMMIIIISSYYGTFAVLYFQTISCENNFISPFPVSICYFNGAALHLIRTEQKLFLQVFLEDTKRRGKYHKDLANNRET